MLKKLTLLKLKKLQAVAGEDLVTIYIPLLKGPVGHKQNKSQFHAIRSELKKHLDTNQHRLLSDMLENVHNMLGYVHAHSGVLVTMHGNDMSVYSLPFTPDLGWHIGATYHLQQIKNYYITNKPFYVLAISKKGSHLFKGDKASLSHIPVDEIGKDIETLLRLDEGNVDSLQNHSEGAAGKRGAKGFHGNGGFKEVKKTLFESYLRVVDKKVMNAIKDKKTPLVLVAVGYGQSMYRHISKYPSIAAQNLATNPDELSTQDLHSKIVPLLY